MMSGSEPSVLVVDDEPSILVLISVILERNGIRALLARNGKEALEIAQREHVAIDLILTDVMMPEISGTELVAQIREIRGDLRVLYMSAYSDGEVLRIELLRSGAGFISKPFDNGELLATVRRTLSAQRARTSSISSLN